MAFKRTIHPVDAHPRSPMGALPEGGTLIPRKNLYEKIEWLENNDDQLRNFSLEEPATWTGAIYRCPCGTGICAKMAVLHAKGQLPLQKDFRHQGILGNILTGRLIEETTIVGLPAVVPTITGQSWIYGINNFFWIMMIRLMKGLWSVISGPDFPERQL